MTQKQWAHRRQHIRTRDWAFCVFLLEWDNIEGPINAFVPVEHANKPFEGIPKDMIESVFLVNRLEGDCVNDTKVAHYVGPVWLRQGFEYGRRTIVILSYKPLIPLHPADFEKTVELLRKEPQLLAETPPVQDSIAIDVATVSRTDQDTTSGQLGSEILCRAACRPDLGKFC